MADNEPKEASTTNDIAAVNMRWLKEQKEVSKPLSTTKKRKRTTERKTSKQGLRDFDAWIGRLRLYRNQHGHCNVPNPRAKLNRGETLSHEEKLGRWCAYVRAQYKIFRKAEQEGSNSRTSLSIENILLLVDMGFTFVLRPPDALPPSWETRIEQCKEFKTKNGHLKIPTTHPVLGGFCGKIRDNFRLKRQGKKSTLTDEKEKQLTDLGFVFQVHAWHQKKEVVSWDDRLEEFKEYVKKNGCPHVPKTFGTLGRWVKSQRRMYRYMNAEDKRSTLTQERYLKLNAAGFAWTARGKSNHHLKKPTATMDPESEDDEDSGEEEEAPPRISNPYSFYPASHL